MSRQQTSWKVLLLCMLLLLNVFASAAPSSQTITQTVNKATPTVALSTDGATITYGSPVQITASLSFKPDGVTKPATPATGTITFFDNGTPLSGGTITVTSGGAVITLPLLTGGSHSITAQYSGDSNFNGASASTPIVETVVKAAPAISLATSKSPANVAEPITLTAQLPGDASGTVTFMEGSTTLGTAPLALNAGKQEANLTLSTLSVGTHSLTAVYSGDINYVSATSSAINQVISKADSWIDIVAAPNSGPVGTNIALKATVSTGGTALDAADVIKFADGATTLQNVTITPVQTTNLALNSDDFTQSAWQTSNAAVSGTRVQGPTTNTTANSFTPSTNAGFLYQTINGLTATQQYTFSAWLAVPTGTQTVNLAVNDSTQTVIGTPTSCAVSTTWTRCSVTVTIPSGVTTANLAIGNGVTGGTQVNVYGAQFEQAASFGPYVRTTTTSLKADGAIATMSVNSLTAGTHTISATFAGDGNLNGSAASTVVTIGKADSSSESITLTSSAPTAVYGTNVTFTATVAPINGIVATGTVTFKDGATTLGTGTLDASGKATFSTSALIGGSHSITAEYAGDANFSAITSSALTQTITKADGTVSITSSVNPSTYGDTIVYTITVSGVGVVPTGTVQIDDGGTNLGAPITLDASGSATFSINSLTAGTHTIRVTYLGDQNYQ